MTTWNVSNRWNVPDRPNVRRRNKVIINPWYIYTTPRKMIDNRFHYSWLVSLFTINLVTSIRGIILCVKRYEISFLKNDFRNPRKATLASYKASIFLFYWGGLRLYSAFLPTDFHLWCHKRTTNSENTCQLLWKWCCAKAAPESHSWMS